MISPIGVANLRYDANLERNITLQRPNINTK
jgi:hypothetical protein